MEQDNHEHDEGGCDCGHPICKEMHEALDRMEQVALSQRVQAPKSHALVINLNGCSVVDVAHALSGATYVKDVWPIEVRELVSNVGVEWFPETLDVNMKLRTNDLHDLRRRVCNVIGIKNEDGSPLTKAQMDPWVVAFALPGPGEAHPETVTPEA